MTSETYTPHPLRGISIAALFPMLLERENLSPYAARAVLTELMEGVLGPVEISPPLPRGWRLVFSGNSIAIETATATISDNDVFVKHAPGWERRGRPFVPTTVMLSVPIDPAPEAQEPQPAAATEQAAEPPTPSTPAAEPEPQSQKTAAAKDTPAATPDVTPEAPARERAVPWLAERLNLDDSVKRKTWQAECIRQFRISTKQYRTYVWPEARKSKGLPPLGTPGRPKKSPS